MSSVYWILVCWCVAQRLAELGYSKRNQRKLAQDGFQFQERPAAFQSMVLVHVLWIVGLFLEPLLLPRMVPEWLAICGVLLFLAGQLLRGWVLFTLGKHWNVTVMRPEGTGDFVSSGPYRFIRHPNYLAIILEFISLPVVNGAVVTAVVGSLLNGLVLRGRMKHEDEALFRDSHYHEVMAGRASLVPGIF